MMLWQVAEKRSSAAFPSSFVIAAYRKYASFLRISAALHLTIFEQLEKDDFFSSLLERKRNLFLIYLPLGINRKRVSTDDQTGGISEQGMTKERLPDLEF